MYGFGLVCVGHLELLTEKQNSRNSEPSLFEGELNNPGHGGQPHFRRRQCLGFHFERFIFPESAMAQLERLAKESDKSRHCRGETGMLIWPMISWRPLLLLAAQKGNQESKDGLKTASICTPWKGSTDPSNSFRIWNGGKRALSARNAGLCGMQQARRFACGLDAMTSGKSRQKKGKLMDECLWDLLYERCYRNHEPLLMDEKGFPR